MQKLQPKSATVENLRPILLEISSQLVVRVPVSKAIVAETDLKKPSTDAREA
jgi:hypothetical protein